MAFFGKGTNYNQKGMRGGHYGYGGGNKSTKEFKGMASGYSTSKKMIDPMCKAPKLTQKGLFKGYKG